MPNLQREFIEEKVNEFEGLACFHEVPIDALAKIELRQFMVQSLEQAYTQGKEDAVREILGLVEHNPTFHPDPIIRAYAKSNNITLEKEEEVLPDNKEN